MTTLMTNTTGNVTLGDEQDAIHVKVPTDRSFLSIAGINTFNDAEEFNSDGWVYKQGKKIRKWFVNLSAENSTGYWRIWEPKLSNVVALEALRWKSKQYVEWWYARWFMPPYKAICALGGDVIVVHAIASHARQNPDRNQWCRYEFFIINEYMFENDDWPYSYSFNWEEGEVKNPINHELGQAFYDVAIVSPKIHNRKYIFEVAFERAITKWLRNPDNIAPPKCEETLCLNINERKYWFSGSVNSFGGFDWKKAFWPGGKLIEININ